MAVTAADIKALSSQFDNVSDADIEAQIAAATIAVNIQAHGWSDEDKDYAIARLAAHYVSMQHNLVTVHYTIAGISESVAFKPGSGLQGTIWGQQYEKFLALKGGNAVRLVRTG